MFNSDSITIPLTRGYTATVDLIDSDLAKFKWYATAGDKNKYAIRNSPYDTSGKRHTLHMHRIILARVLGRELLPHEKVDHEDGNGFNNTRSNIRLATQLQNCHNRRIRKDNTTGFKGVRKHTSRYGKVSYHAYIHVNGKRVSLGYHDTPEIAHAAYTKAAKQHFGEFSRDQ